MTKSTYSLDPSASSIKEGGKLTTTVVTDNVKPGTVLFWTLSGIDADDLAKGELKGFGRVSRTGSFSFSHLFKEDLTKEGNEKLIISLFSDKSLKTPVAKTAVKLIDGPSSPVETETDLEIDNHVIPARFSGKKIAVKRLIDFSSQKGKTEFTFSNSPNGGHFEFRNKNYQGKDLKNISIKELSNVFYVAKAPEGNYDPSKLKIVATKVPTETHKPTGDPTNPKGSTELAIKESLKKVQQRQDPFNPLASLKNGANPSISDQISVRVHSPEGTSKPVSAEWITRGNWKPEITAFRQKFSAAKPNERGIPITDIFDIHDLDGDNISQIKIKDVSPQKHTGYFKYNKKSYQGTALPLLNESKLSRVTYHPGPGGTNTIEIDASDSQNGTARTLRTDLITKKAPITSLSNIKQIFDSEDIGRPIPLANLININTSEVTDTNTYSLNLKSKGKKTKALGYFSLKNKKLNPKQLTGLSQETVRDIQFVPTNSKIESTFTLKATDGSGKTTSSSTKWKSKKDKKPSVEVAPMRLAASQAKQPISVSNLINADDDSGSVDSYTLKSVKGKGSFQYKGKKYSNKILTVAAEDLGLVKYIAPKSGKKDRVRVTASDGNQESTPVFVNWETLESTSNLGSLSRTFTLGINKKWEVGDFLGVDNEQTYSKFFGMDKTIGNIDFNRGIGVAGIELDTGSTRMKAGLQLDAGYGLGSLTLQGGLSAKATLDQNGLTFSGTSSDPTLDFELPYAYLNLDAVGKFKFSPSLKLWYDVWLASGKTGNLLSFLNTNVDLNQPILDLDTRDITGNNFTRSFNIGAFSANASIPKFGNVSELNSVPSAIRNSSGWSDGFGNGIAYGIEGSQTLLDLNLSLGQVASYFGLPLSINKSIWGGDISVTGTLADASIGIDAELDYAANVAVKPNVYATIEGSTPNRKYDILGNNSSINPNQFSDTNNDGKISVTIEADPIISANASVSIEGGLDASAEVLSASARINKWGINKTWNAGPLWDWGPQDLYSNTVSLVDLTKTYALSDIAPNLQDSLSFTFDLPVA